MDENQRSILMLGTVQFDPDIRRLADAQGKTLPLRPQSLAVLSILAENTGDAVSKNDLIASAWGSVHVTDDSLIQCIADIRRAISDDDHVFVQTVPRVGYRLVATQPMIAAASDKKRHLPKLALVILGVIALAVIVLSMVNSRPPAVSARPSIAVLPFGHISDDESRAFFTDGISKAITANLSRFEGLFVVSSFSAFQFRETIQTSEEIAQELGVRFLLTGDVQSDEDTIRVNAQLIDGSTGNALWAERYDMPRANVFDLQDDLTGKIAVTLIERIEASARNVERTSLDAYDLVLRAVFTSIDKESLLSDINLLERAISLDPDYSRAHAELSDRYLLLWRHSLADDLDDALRKARAAGTRAIEVNNNSAESRLTLAKIYLYVDLDHELALETMFKALETNPNDADLMVQLAQTLAFMGRGDEAIIWIEKAMRQNPLHPAWYNWNAGFVYGKAGAHDRAILESKKALAVYRSSASIRRVLIFSHGELGQWEDAKRYASEILTQTPDFRLSTHMRNSPHMKPEELQHIMEVLHKAGLPM